MNERRVEGRLREVMAGLERMLGWAFETSRTARRMGWEVCRRAWRRVAKPMCPVAPIKLVRYVYALMYIILEYLLGGGGSGWWLTWWLGGDVDLGNRGERGFATVRMLAWLLATRLRQECLDVHNEV